MRKRKLNNKGFSLIEVIVTLLLVGITAAMAGMWIVSVANGYIFAKMNMETAQKAQLAMTRLVKEFSAISYIDTASSATQITYRRYDFASGGFEPPTVDHHVVLNSGILELDGNILTDHVSGFTLSYCNNVNSGPGNCFSTWNPATSRVIEITLTLTGPDDIPSTFKKRVVPRNI